MENQKAYAKLIAKCWSDPKFKEQLLKDPETILKQNGIEIPKGQKVKVVENTQDVLNFVIPQKPAGQLSEKDLEAVAAGDFGDCTSDQMRGK